jgi:hypothetical protein
MAVGYNKNNKAVKRVENSKFTKRSFIKNGINQAANIQYVSQIKELNTD